MIDSIIYLTPTGSGQMPEEDNCLILKNGEAYFKTFPISKWEKVKLSIIYTLTESGSNQSIGDVNNYTLPQFSPESRFLIGFKNGGDENLPLKQNTYFLGYGGPSITSSLEIYSNNEVVKIRPSISGSDRGGFCFISSYFVTGSVSEEHSGSVLYTNIISGSYSDTPYNVMTMNFEQSASVYKFDYSQSETDSPSIENVSHSISNYVPRYTFPDIYAEIPPSIFMNALFIKSPEHGPFLRIHALGVVREQ
jgi:hypothetical protein